jgi:hypothetical protein
MGKFERIWDQEKFKENQLVSDGYETRNLLKGSGLILQ